MNAAQPGPLPSLTDPAIPLSKHDSPAGADRCPYSPAHSHSPPSSAKQRLDLCCRLWATKHSSVHTTKRSRVRESARLSTYTLRHLNTQAFRRLRVRTTEHLNTQALKRLSDQAFTRPSVQVPATPQTQRPVALCPASQATGRSASRTPNGQAKPRPTLPKHARRNDGQNHRVQVIGRPASPFIHPNKIQGD